MDAEVVIIGAGPAGLSAAKILSDHGVDFALLAREETPCKDKPCGGFVPEAALTEFKLGHFEGSFPITALRATFPGGVSFERDFRMPVGVNASREDLGAAQLRQIGKRGSIWLGSEAGKVSINEDGVVIAYRREDVLDTISTNLLIDASGATPLSLRFLNFRDRISNSQMGYAVQYQMELIPHEPPPPPMVDFYYGSDYSPGGYAWCFPRADSAAVGSGGIISRIRSDGKRVHDYLEYLLAHSESAKALLKGMRVRKTESALMPLAGIVRPSYSNRIMLAGDAAGHCSPITGEGIAYSMKAGKHAALTAIDAISKNDFSRKRLSDYEKKWTSDFGSDLKWGLWLQERLLQGGGSKSMGRGFLSTEKSQKMIAQMLIGKRSVRSAILNSIPSYLKSKLQVSKRE